MYIKSEHVNELIALIEQLIAESGNKALMLRGHKRSKNNGESWEKTNRAEVLGRALDILKPKPDTEDITSPYEGEPPSE